MLEPIISPDPFFTQKKDDRRGRSPHQPRQKTIDLKRSYEVISPNLQAYDDRIKYFDDKQRQYLIDKTISKYPGTVVTENFFKDNSKVEGVRVFEKIQKNMDSVQDYNLISNLTS